MFELGNVYSRVRAGALAVAAVALAFTGLQPAQAVAPIGSSSLLKQTQTQNLPGIDGANAAANLRWLPNSVVLNDQVYYIASTDATGAELFTSDGTAAGTYVVKESTVGPSSSLYVYNTKLTVSNGKIYYWGPGNEAYVSDGTAAGTGMLKKLSTRMSSQPQQFTKVGTKTFFTAYDSSVYYNDYTATSQGYAGYELWVTDGTSAGTSMVKDIYPGNYLSNGTYYNNNSNVANITECNNNAYFTANDGVNGIELWMSDGTNAGTNLVKDIYAGLSSANPTNLACVNNKLIFNANSPTGGAEPWVSDGTSAGTFQLKDIVAGAGGSGPVGMYSSLGKVYFNAYDSTNGNELWSTDGTSAGTVLVKNINPGASNSSPSNFVTMGGKTYFSATDSRGTELWVTDGTTVGTLFVADINQTAPGAGSSPKDMYAWNGKLYFSADNGLVGREPWVTDGTNSGTRLIRDMFPGISDMLDQSNTTTNVPFFAGTSAGLFFTANSPIYSQEMWITDGTDAGTHIVVDAKSGPGYSYAKDGIAFNGRIYFAASSAYYGQELWSTDLAGNTQQLLDIYPGAPSGLRTDLAHNMVVYNNRLYFTARNATNGYELWSTDGTAAGTTQAFDLNPNNSGTNSASYNGPRYMTVCNGKLFMNWSTSSDYELYVSDGTLAGTSMVKNINASLGSEPQQLTCFNNTLYFTADDSYYWQTATNTVGRELYKSDGTSAGTVLVTDLNTAAMTLGSGAGTNNSYPSYLTVVGGYLYFSATNTSNENELYYTDGTTVTKIDVYAGANSGSPAYLVKYNNQLYFQGTTAAAGRDMLKLDPTTQTVTAVDVGAGAAGFTFYQPVVMGGLMWFQSSGEMWTSDGTAANTGQFEDLLPGGNSNPDWLFSLGGVVMYLTYDSSLGSQPRFIVGNAIYTVSFNGNGSTGGTAPADVSVMSVSASVPGNTGNLAKTNYRFVGWNTSPSGVGTSYLPGATITPIVDTPLFAQWATNTTYTVTYDANGATGGVAAPAVGNVDTPIYLDNNSGNLSKPGYTFGGWNTAANGTGTSYAAGYRYTATANVTLYAKWTALPTFSITFNGNGITSGAAPASLTGVYSTATLPGVGTMAKTGFVFAGWNTATDGLGSAYAAGETLTPQANLTLYAQWTANPTYTLTYDANGATSGSVPALATASSTYVVIDNNTGSLFKTGYVFSGWNTAADGSGTNYTGNNNFLLNANTTFYAKWVLANYTVTYSGNGNTGGTAPAAATGVSVSTVTPANTGTLVKAGYTFVGWNTLASGLGTDYAVGATFSPTSSTTLYAKWTALPTYTITYNGNGNTGGGVPVAQSGIYAAVNLDANSGALVKSGSYFAGWNTQADGLGIHYGAGTSFTPSANITLYAEWSLTQTYTLTYDGNSKTGGVAPVPQTGITSTSTVLGNTGSLTRLGYRFDGWNTLANGTGSTYLAGSTITLSADTTLFAIWTAVPTYTLTYSGNGQTTGSVPLAVTTSDGTVALSANINVLTKSNYNFTGWNTAANGTGTHYNVGDAFPLTANTTIYAEWTPMSYTLTYNSNGAGSGSVPNPTTAAGAQTVAANTGSLALTNYGFTGWNTAADGSGTSYAAGASITLTANTTLFAKWTTYVITYDANGATSGSAPAAVSRYGTFALATAGSLARTAYSFGGWNTLANGTGTTYAAGANYNAAATATLYAVWTLLPVYVISYNANGATSGSVPTSQSGNAGSYTLATNTGSLARTGYIFDGWNTAANGSGTSYAVSTSYSLGASVTMYANWVQLFALTFDGNGATAGSSPIFANSLASTITLPGNDGSYAKTGYLFGGWNTAANGTGTNYAGGASYALTANATLYANWVRLYAITFDGNGATSGSAPTLNPVVAGTVALAGNTGSLALNGFYFGGWNTAANGSGTTYAAGANYSLASDVTLYAIWTPSVRTITFDGNGAQLGNVPAAITVAPGAVTLPFNLGGLQRDGYNFTGWNTAANGSGTFTNPGGTFTLSNDITLYAIWALKPVVPITANWISRLTIGLAGGQVTLTGSGFDTVTSVSLAGVAVPVVFQSNGTITLNLPAMPAGAYNLLFIGTSAKLLYGQALSYIGDKSVTFANFFAVKKLTGVQLQSVDAAVSSARGFKVVVLTPTTKTVKGLAIKQIPIAFAQLLALQQRLAKVYQLNVIVNVSLGLNQTINDLTLTFKQTN